MLLSLTKLKNRSEKLYFYTFNPLKMIGSVNIDGSNKVFYTPPCSYNDSDFDIDESGNYLVFDSDSSGSYNIHVKNLNTLDSKQMTNHTSMAAYPRWAHTKNGFFYILSITTDKRYIYYYNLDTEQTQLIIEIND